MHVDFGGGDAFVSEHLLDGSQVGPALKQMRGEGMAQRVGTDVFSDAAVGTQLLDDDKHHLARQLPAAKAIW